MGRSRLSLLRATLEATADGIYVVDRNRDVLAFNQRLIELWRIPAEILETRDNSKVIDFALQHLKEPETFVSRILEVNSRPDQESCDVVEHKDGRSFERTSKPLRLDGEIVGRVWSFREITARLRTERALRDSEERYRTIVEAAHDAIWSLDTAGTVTFVNARGLALGGFQASDVVGKRFSMGIHPDDIATAAQAFTRTLAGEPQTHEARIRLPGGRTIRLLVNTVPIRADGRIVGTVGFGRDITDQKRAEEALRESEERYRTIVETAHDAVWMLDAEGRFTFVNRPGLALGGFEPANVIGKSFASFIHPEDRPRVEAAARKVLAGEPQTYTTRVNLPGGRSICIVVNKVPIWESGKVVGAVGIGRDVTEQLAAAQALKASEERYRLLFERNLAGVFRTSVDGRVLECNDSYARMFGFASREECQTQNAVGLYFDPAERDRLIAKLQSAGAVTNEELQLRRRDGRPVWILANIALLDGEQGTPSVLEGTIIDITDWKRAEEQIAFQAYHDALTGLPNRTLYRDRLTQAVAHARRSNGSLAVMLLDLDHFKDVNDSYGTAAGDLVLREVAARLAGCLREGDSVARVGSDEFNLLVQDVSREGDVAKIAQNVRDAIAHPFQVDGTQLYVTSSIGISLYPGDGDDADALLKGADNALFRAKELGRNAYQLASHAMSLRTRERLALGNGLHRALEREEFLLHYQPQVDLTTGELVGVEALIRWLHPERGLLFPGDFITIAEETRLIVPMGEWVLGAACRQARAWQNGGHPALRLAVNLSAYQFQQQDLVGVIARTLEATGLSPECLELEITESAAMQNPERSGKVLGALREMGIGISMDDFGTGYSSLNYLKRFPISAVKIDQSFVRDITSDAGDAAIVSAVIAMTRSLRLRTVAEGVETQEQLAFLREHRCGEGQGYFLGRPLPAEDVFA